MTRIRAVLIWLDIGHYHHQRTEATNKLSDIDLEVIELISSSEIKEFRSGVPTDKTYPVERLYDSRAAYAAEIQTGGVWRRTLEALHGLSPDVVAIAGWTAPESLAAIHWVHRHNRRLVVMSA